MSAVLKVLGLMAFCGIKFSLAAPLVALSGYSYFETILIMITGGAAGVLLFFYFGEWIKIWLLKIPRGKKSKEKKIFTRSKRRIVHVKSKYGLIGLAILTPCLFSIPVGSLIAARYFDHDKRTLPFLMASVVIWAFILTSFFYFFD